ncbi:substrate-binding domain-containing protein [Azotobacter chroococcum]|nr:substrate-binding domain-containing protein [Azotobacter chroococcum]
MKILPFFRLPFAIGLLFGMALSTIAHAEPLQFALVAKWINHPFFIQAGKGCAEAAQAEGDTCLLLGPPDSSHFRQQNEVMEQALKMGLDGLALSVTNSAWLAEHALKEAGQTLLITFDSDLGPHERHLRKGYVGLDNLAFGKELGMLAQHFRPQGGKLCILSGSPEDTNHQERIEGIRQQLRGQFEKGVASPLRGENDWSELARCPLYRAANQKDALIKLTTLLASSNQVDVIISTGSWPIQQAELYRQQLGPLLARQEEKAVRPTIIIATPEPGAAQRALLDDGLVQAYLSMESQEIGRQSYRMMKRLAQGKPVPEKVLVDTHIYLSNPLQGTRGDR